MKFFVYGKLKENGPKGWMIPFAISTPYVFLNYRMYLRPEGTAAMVESKGEKDYVVGEIREVRFVWPFNKLLLWFLDLNEGVRRGFYKRVKIDDMWTYLYERPVEGYKTIREWKESPEKGLTAADWDLFPWFW
jgi:hypothetical protein